jgi:hypothetical protein
LCLASLKAFAETDNGSHLTHPPSSRMSCSIGRKISSGQDTVSLLSQASRPTRLSLRDVQRHSPLESEAVRQHEIFGRCPSRGHDSRPSWNGRTHTFNARWMTTRPITRMRP